MGRGENRMGCGGIGVGFLYGMKDKGYRNNGCNLRSVIDGSSDFYERSIFPYSLFQFFESLPCGYNRLPQSRFV